MVLGAFSAQPVLEIVGLANVPYRDTLVIEVAVAVGLLVQVLG